MATLINPNVLTAQQIAEQATPTRIGSALNRVSNRIQNGAGPEWRDMYYKLLEALRICTDGPSW